jgi:uncharacterized Zn-binding protein involved in type VI secretion
MAGLLFHVGASATCPHGGQVAVIPSSSRVLLNGQPAATFSDIYLVAGCPFVVGLAPHPCIKIQWLVPATRVFVNGQPAILQTSFGICQSPEQIPQGPPIIVATQTRVSGI